MSPDAHLLRPCLLYTSVLFFVVGVVKTCGSFVEVKKPEHALKLFVRFALAKALITYGMELMLALLDIIQGVVSSIMNAAGFGAPSSTVLPAEIVTAIEDCGFFESIPLWAVTLIGGLLIWVLSFVMILSVYGRFFKMYMYAALAPIPLSTFAGEPSQNVGKSFLKSYAAEMCIRDRAYVSCMNCREDTAAAQFMETKRLWGKLDGRVCYHGYQSFQADEVNAETAHELSLIHI